jgi:hypothetical protein
MTSSSLFFVLIGSILVFFICVLLRYLALLGRARNIGPIPNGIAQGFLLQNVRRELPHGALRKRVRSLEAAAMTAWIVGTIALVVHQFKK